MSRGAPPGMALFASPESLGVAELEGATGREEWRSACLEVVSKAAAVQEIAGEAPVTDKAEKLVTGEYSVSVGRV